MPRRIAPLAAILLTTGCATIFSGTTQDVAIRTTPGASYHITNDSGQQVASGNTGGTHNLVRGAGYFSPQAYKLRINKPGYQGQTIDIGPSVNPWYFANILLGGLVGMVIVDPITGAMFNLYPRDIDAQLQPLASADAAPTTPRQQAQPAAGNTRPIASRHDYTAWQSAKGAGCQPLADPGISDAGQPIETYTFACGDGRKLTLTCESGFGCK